VIVTAVIRKDTGETDVLVAPITHSSPREAEVAIEIPHKVRRHLGLDDERGYIIADEVNTVSWDDAGIVPVRPGQQWVYGRIPKGLYDQLRAAMLILLSKQRLKIANRER